MHQQRACKPGHEPRWFAKGIILSNSVLSLAADLTKTLKKYRLMINLGGAMLKELISNYCSIRFLSGSRVQTCYIYRNENPLKLAWRSPPGQPLQLTDFKSVEFLAPGPLCTALVRCTFNDGEEAVARVSYSMLEVLYAFTSTPQNLTTFPTSYISFQFSILVGGIVFLMLFR